MKSQRRPRSGLGDILLSAADLEALDVLADQLGISRAEAARRCIEYGLKYWTPAADRLRDEAAARRTP